MRIRQMQKKVTRDQKATILVQQPISKLPRYWNNRNYTKTMRETKHKYIQNNLNKFATFLIFSIRVCWCCRLSVSCFVIICFMFCVHVRDGFCECAAPIGARQSTTLRRKFVLLQLCNCTPWIFFGRRFVSVGARANTINFHALPAAQAYPHRATLCVRTA